MVSFFRRGDTVDRVVVNQTTDSIYAIRFDLTPENEGYYYCTIGGSKSVNEIELVGKFIIIVITYFELTIMYNATLKLCFIFELLNINDKPL